MNWLIGLVLIAGFAILLQAARVLRQSFALSSRLDTQFGPSGSNLSGMLSKLSLASSETNKLKTCHVCITSLESTLVLIISYLVIIMVTLSIQMF